jgi:hypothetical protein
LDYDANLLMVGDKGFVAKAELMLLCQLHECLVFVILPARVVEVFIEHNLAARLYTRMEEVEHALCSCIKVTIYMKERNLLIVLLDKIWQRLREPSFDDCDIGRYSGEFF